MLEKVAKETTKKCDKNYSGNDVKLKYIPDRMSSVGENRSFGGITRGSPGIDFNKVINEVMESWFSEKPIRPPVIINNKIFPHR